jgi:hypothetical protein
MRGRRLRGQCQRPLEALLGFRRAAFAGKRDAQVDVNARGAGAQRKRRAVESDAVRRRPQAIRRLRDSAAGELGEGSSGGAVKRTDDAIGGPPDRAMLERPVQGWRLGRVRPSIAEQRRSSLLHPCERSAANGDRGRLYPTVLAGHAYQSDPRELRRSAEGGKHEFGHRRSSQHSGRAHRWRGRSHFRHGFDGDRFKRRTCADDSTRP